MEIIEKNITIKEALEKYELPFMMRRPHFTSNFAFRVEKLVNENVYGTAFRNGIEYSGSYSYNLADIVDIFEGAVKKEDRIIAPAVEETLPDLLGFSDNILFTEFFSEKLMNASFFEVMQGNLEKTISIRILVINYLCLIKRKFRVLFKDELLADRLEYFRLFFPAYHGISLSSFMTLNKLIDYILDYSFGRSTKTYQWYHFTLDTDLD